MANSNIEEGLLLQHQQQEQESNSSSGRDLGRKIWKETKLIFGIAVPGAIARVTSFGSIMVTQIFMGHISELALASFALDQSIVLSVRVSNELGRGEAKAAKFSIFVVLAITTCLGLVFFVLCLCLIYGKQISYLFTSNEQVAEAVSSLSIMLSFNILLNSIQPVLSGVAVGAGLQGMVAIVSLGSYYVIGIPIGAVLAYVVGLRIKGLWIGMLTEMVVKVLHYHFSYGESRRGVAIGAGLHGMVAVVNMASYDVIGVPMGAVLASLCGWSAN